MYNLHSYSILGVTTIALDPVWPKDTPRIAVLLCYVKCCIVFSSVDGVALERLICNTCDSVRVY